MKRPALFLDRDGVINIDFGYVYLPRDFQFIEGVFDLVATAKQLGYLVVVVTNQAGIGRGYYSEQQFHYLTQWMRAKFKENGSAIDAVYFCPFHSKHGIGHYRTKSFFRKPAPGMFLLAEFELEIDMEQSILIGDKPSDMAAGLAAGIKTLLHFCGQNNGRNTVVINRLSDAIPYMHSLAEISQNS
jgi:D-glycero-D-manno-heptose 1,7-bisphosphate phosphatase